MAAQLTMIVQYGITVVWAMGCGGYDLVLRRIPNVLTLGAHGGALIMLVVNGQGLFAASVASCLIAWFLALALTLPAHAFNRLGAGDVKMLAAIGLASGLETMLIAYVIAGLLMGGVAVIKLMAYRWASWFAPQLMRSGINAPVIAEPNGRFLPFGAALAVGFIAALLIGAGGFPILLIDL